MKKCLPNKNYLRFILSFLLLTLSCGIIFGQDPCDPVASGNPDGDGDGISNICDLDSDNDGILNSVENSTCGVSDFNVAPGNGVIIQPLFIENFGTQSTTTGTNSVSLAGLGSGATTTYNYYQATTGTVPTNYKDGAAPPYSLQDGRYTIFNAIQYTSSWASGKWQTIGDHTNGGSTPSTGRMFIVNAGITPGEFYRRTLTGVAAGAPINVSFWIMNIDICQVSQGCL